MVIPCSAKSFITLSTSPTISGSRAEVGSSKSMISGFIASARAIATRCFWPPDKLSGMASRLSDKPTFSNNSIPTFSASVLSKSLCSIGANVILSRTVMCGKRLKCWNTIPIFERKASTSVLGSVKS